MIAAESPRTEAPRLLALGADGGIRHLDRTSLRTLFEPGDLVVANDAATLPASLAGRHAASGAAIEVRLAAWARLDDPTRFTAIVFGVGDHRMRTEERPAPPTLRPGDGLFLGPLTGRVTEVLDHPRLIVLRFAGTDAFVWAGIARHGRPIQYAHVKKRLALWDVWTRIAAHPVAFESPSAGFVLDWRTIAAWRSRGVGFATLTHAAGISSTGDPVLDRRLPFDEPYHIPARTAAVIHRTKAHGGHVIAVGTTVVRALEAAAAEGRMPQVGDGIARGRIGPGTPLRVVDAILSGVHEAGESHFELLRAFTDDDALRRMAAALASHAYRGHEFGDSVLIERVRPPRSGGDSTRRGLVIFS